MASVNSPTAKVAWLADERTEIGGVAARGHHDRRRVAVRRQARRDLEAVDGGELDVEKDDVRTQGGNRLQGALAVGRLADDLESGALEHTAGRVSEASV